MNIRNLRKSNLSLLRERIRITKDRIAGTSDVVNIKWDLYGSLAPIRGLSYRSLHFTSYGTIENVFYSDSDVVIETAHYRVHAELTEEALNLLLDGTKLHEKLLGVVNGKGVTFYSIIAKTQEKAIRERLKGTCPHCDLSDNFKEL